MRHIADAFRPVRKRRTVGLSAAALAVLGIVAGLSAQAGSPTDRLPLRVCSDPNNMPFSNANGEGFENKLAEMVAAQVGKRLSYTWAAQDDNFIHETLKAGKCDVVMGVPTELGSTETTRPYYWSSYVLISRADRHLDINSLKDHTLKTLKIGVASFAGNKLFSPPAQALAHAGMLDNIVAFPIDGSGDGIDPKARIVDAVARGDVDMAALWGPQVGYFVQRAPVPLTMTRIDDTDEFSARKTHIELFVLQFEIAMGVRKGDEALRAALDQVIALKQADINALLRSYNVPLIEPAKLAAAAPGAASE